jgi:hypothetical protein
MTTVTEFKTKKEAKETGHFTRDQWFKKYRAPYHGETGIAFRGDEYFRESQTEELFSKSKGAKEIGPLKVGARSVGQKKYRTVRFQVYRESDFILEDRLVRKIPPARTVDLIDAVVKITNTAAKFTAASENSAKKKNYKRSRGFRSRARKLQEVIDIGLRRAILLELVSHVGKRGGIHRYFAEGHEFRSRVAPPDWFETNQSVIREPKEKYQVGSGAVRLMDAIYTIEPFRDDVTLNW